MRYLFIPLLFSFNAFAQLDVGTGALGVCTDITFQSASPSNDNIYNCTDVIITSLSTADFAHTAPQRPLVIKAQGTVSIDDIDFSGETSTTNLGGAAGLAGGEGGSYVAGGNDGSPASQGGRTSVPASCSTLLTEGSGGGGGSLVARGKNGFAGTLLTGAGGSNSPGGLPGDVVTVDVNNITFGGSGGGSGESGCTGPATPIAAGGGGGGGGAIRIVAGKDVTINGSVNVSGGDGATLATISGAGGGGSGGIVAIQSMGQITLTPTGSIGAYPGAGGANSTGTTAGDGGEGAGGMIFLQDLDGIVTGAIGPDASISPIGERHVKSKISCGTISKKQEETFYTQMILGFAIVILFKILFRSPKKIS